MTAYPVGGEWHPYWAQEDRRSDVAAVESNAGQPAIVHAQFATWGGGEIKYPADAVEGGDEPVPLWFGVSFVARPAVTYGASLRMCRLPASGFPRCFGGIWKWRVTTKGMYIGAFAWVSVDCDTDLGITHSFGFAGNALKTTLGG